MTKPICTAIVSSEPSTLLRDQRSRSAGRTADAEDHVLIENVIATASSASERHRARSGTSIAGIIRCVETRLLRADAPGAVEEAAAALARGELVAFPTDTVYGLAAGHGHIEKLFVAKGRPKDKRIPVLLADAANLEASAIVTPIARALAERFWPGPLTIVLVAPRRGTLAFRVPASDVARRLIAASGGGLPVTSANLSGQPDATTAEEVIAQLGGRIALVLDGGPTRGGVPSTVVDCTGTGIRILREGAIPESEIDRAIREPRAAAPRGGGEADRRDRWGAA